MDPGHALFEFTGRQQGGLKFLTPYRLDLSRVDTASALTKRITPGGVCLWDVCLRNGGEAGVVCFHRFGGGSPNCVDHIVIFRVRRLGARPRLTEEPGEGIIQTIGECSIPGIVSPSA